MTGLILGLTWIGLGGLAALLLTPLRQRRLAPLVPAAVAVVAGAFASHGGVWTGPLTSDATEALSLGRVAAGMLAAAALSLSITRAMAPGGEGHDILATAVVGAAAVALVSASEPLVWACALILATSVMALRWMTTTPSRATLAAARITGLGAACALAITPFVPPPGQNPAIWPPLVSWLLVAALCAVLALVPFGGWAVGSLRTVRPADAALWLTLVVPAVLLTATRLPAALPLLTRDIVANTLLYAGIASALWGALRACSGPREDCYQRVFLADVGLACAAIGSGGSDALGAVLLIILCHLTIAPLVLHGPIAGWAWTWSCGWLAASGLPPTLTFWARLLALEALAGAGRLALVGGALTLILLSVASVLALAAPRHEGRREPLRARGMQHALIAVAAVIALGIGLIPHLAAQAVFGQF